MHKFEEVAHNYHNIMYLLTAWLTLWGFWDMSAVKFMYSALAPGAGLGRCQLICRSYIVHNQASLQAAWYNYVYLGFVCHP